MPAARFGVPIELVRDLARSLQLRCAIETGTWKGDSAAEMSEVFDRVWSIELDAELHKQAALHHNRPGLEFLQGFSPDVLPEVLRELGEPALFWLDAHWGGSVGAGADLQCPVLDEIRAIDDWDHAPHSCILIDDARWFLGPPDPKLRREDWPTFLEVLDLLRHRHDRYATIVEDVIVAGPPQIRGALDDYFLKVQWRQLEAERYRFEDEARGQTRVIEELSREVNDRPIRKTVKRVASSHAPRWAVEAFRRLRDHDERPTG